MVDYLRVVLSNTWINLTYTTGHFVLKQLAVNVRYAEILALPLNVPFWPNSGHTCLKTIASGMTGLKAEQTSLAAAGAVKDLQSGPSRMCGVSQHESVIERLQAKKSNWRSRPKSGRTARRALTNHFS